MLLKSTVGVLYLASVASATFFPLQPHCWKKCARQAGLMCNWADVSCLCKAANNGILVKANTCACSACEDWEFGNDDKTKRQIKELSGACSWAQTPLSGAAASAAFQAATCEGSGPTPPPGGAQPLPKPPAPPAPPPVAPWGPPKDTPPPKGPPPPKEGPPPPPKAVPPPQGAFPSPYSTLTIAVPPKAQAPTSFAAVIPYSTASAAWGTTVIQSTVMVSPSPMFPGGETSTASATSTTTATSSPTKSKSPSVATGAATRPDLKWAGSLLAVVAGLAYGVA